MTQIKINGRSHRYNRIDAVTYAGSGDWTVTAPHGPFTVFGGRAAGAARNEWFLSHEDWTKPIRCTSLVDALNLIEGM